VTGVVAELVAEDGRREGEPGDRQHSKVLPPAGHDDATRGGQVEGRCPEPQAVPGDNRLHDEDGGRVDADPVERYVFVAAAFSAVLRTNLLPNTRLS